MYKCTAGLDKDWNEYGFTSCLFAGAAAGAEADAGAGAGAGAEATDDDDSEETLHLSASCGGPSLTVRKRKAPKKGAHKVKKKLTKRRAMQQEDERNVL